MVANRFAYGEELHKLFGENGKLFVVDADCIGGLNCKAIERDYPERFIECGISEQDQYSIAAGLASCGMTVFAATFAVFTTMRALDQIRNQICYNRFDVKCIGTHSGLETGFDGGTHQSVEDIAIMRALPNMRVLAPSTPNMTRKLTRLMADTYGPFYMRFGREGNVELYDENEQFHIGGSRLLREGKDVSLLACGRMTEYSLQAAELLYKEGIDARVVDMYSIKPVDTEAIKAAMEQTSLIFTIEDHNIIGGLGGAVCEYTAETCPARVVRIGIDDKFGRSGTVKDLYEKYGLNPVHIAEKVKRAFNK